MKNIFHSCGIALPTIKGQKPNDGNGISGSIIHHFVALEKTQILK